MNVIQLPYGSLADLAGYFNTNGKILAPGEVFIQYTPGSAKFEDLSSTTTYSSFDGKKVDSSGAIVDAVAGDGGLSTAPDGKVYDQNGLQIRKVYNGEMFAGTGRSDCYVRIGSAEALKFGGLVTEAESKEKAKNNPYRLYLIVGDTDAKVDVTISLLDGKNEIVEDGIPTTEKENYSEGGHLFDYIFADAVGNVYYFNQYSAVGTKVYINATGNGLIDETFGNASHIDSKSLAYNGQTVADFEKDTNVTEKTLKDLINTVLPKYCHYEGTVSDILNDSTTINGAAPSTAKGAAYYCDLDSTTTETSINYYHLLTTDAAVTSDDKNVTVTGTAIFNDSNKGLVNNYKKHDRLYEGDIVYFEEDNTINVIPLGYLIQALNHVTVTRSDEYAKQRWESEDNRVNAITKNLSEAILLLSKSKADLDPTTLKLITSEIPDWLLSAPKYQSTITETHFDYDAGTEPSDYDGSYEIFGTPKSTAATDAATYLQSVFKNLGFDTTVTAKDGGGFTVTTSTDADANEDSEKTTEDTSTDSSLISGMYWIYNGAALSLTTTRANANEVIANNIIANIFDIPDGDDGELHPGDWVIWNATKGKFEKLDHSDNLTSVNVWINEDKTEDHKGTDHALTYVPTFTTATRNVFGGKTYLDYEDDVFITEAEFESSDQRYAELGTDNAVLTVEDLNKNGIIIGNKDKTVVESAEIIANKTAGFDITPRKGGIGDPDESLPVTTNIIFNGDVSSYTAKDKTAFKPYVFNRDLLKALRIDTVDSDGNPTSKWYDVNYDFAYAIDANGKANATSTIINANYNTDSHTADTTYGYLNDGAAKFDTAEVYIPTTVKGTLTTVEYVNEHVELLEKLIGAAYENMTSGTEDYIQLIWVDTDDVKHIGDSYIANIITTKDLSKLYSATSSKTTADKLEGSRTLTIFNDLTFNASTHAATHGSQFNHNIITTQDLSDATVGVESTNKWHDIISYGANDIRSAVPSPDFYGNVGANQVNPTGKKQINNYMPNHSGVLLNNFSVIDCGYWVASKLKSSSETTTSSSTAEASNGAN